ncbi:MAG: phosphoribosyl-ATP diphosphatase [Christensenellaceae bacterium]|jgi:phosphoribosyl-ATP pyrophosphohydrolase|nr:phosphoribosyl-ATP diphosphatase [Christensenellaceae bacterium]
MENTDLVLKELYDVILSRKEEFIEGSYTCYLFSKGLDKILKKCGEECSETIIAAKNGNKNEIIGEVADLVYHLLVMMAECNVDITELINELKIRSNKQRNLKVIKEVNKNS